MQEEKGYASWDPLPDLPSAKQPNVVTTTLTNGLVSGAASDSPRLTNASTTNGTMVASEGGGQGRVLTITYDNNTKSRIVAPASAPIVRCVLQTVPWSRLVARFLQKPIGVTKLH